MRWREAHESDGHFETDLRRGLFELGANRQSEAVALIGLLGYDDITIDEHVKPMLYLPDCWYRFLLVPDEPSEREFAEDQCHRLTAQLGDFFMLPDQGKGLDHSLDHQGAGVDERLLRLFSDAPGVLRNAAYFEAASERLERAIAQSDPEEALAWLTPEFLRFEQLSITYPVTLSPQTRANKKMARRVMSWLNVAPPSDKEIDDRNATQARTSLLRVRLLKSWGWPVGARALAREMTCPTVPWDGGPRWHVLDDEVASFVCAARERFPALFE